MKRLLIGLFVTLTLSFGLSGVAGAYTLKCNPPVGSYWIKYCAIYGPNGSYTQTYNNIYGKGGLYCTLYGYNC